MKKPFYVDCTWVVPNSQPIYKYGIWQDSLYFDLARLKAATPLGSRYPHAKTLATMLGELGVSDGDALIFYDRIGLFTSPFMRWAAKSIGFDDVSIALGSQPNNSYVNSHIKPTARPPVSIKNPLCKGVIMSEVRDALHSQVQIIDPRGRERFQGTEPEPRPGLRSGHIPGSINIPYSDLLDENRNYPKDLSALKILGIDLSQPIITTCGSGVTAAGLANLLENAGATDVSVYLGSWTEWGASDMPIETGAT